jgi:long-chain acyl-CoA synthetase
LTTTRHITGGAPVPQEVATPQAVALPDAANLTDPVWDNADRQPDVVQFLRPISTGTRPNNSGGSGSTGWAEVSCRQFRDEVLALARGQVAAGIDPGMRVGLLSRTRYEWTLIDYAIWTVGAVTVPMYETSSSDQVAWILSDSGASACFVETDEHASLVAAVRDRLPGLREVWRIGADDLAGLTARGDAVDPGEIDVRRTARRGADLATIVYTSGTTGRPKGCMLTHHSMRSDVANAAAALPGLFHEGASTLLFLPLAHAFARLIQIGAVQTRTIMAHSAEIESATDEIRRFRPTFMLSVPRVFEKLYNAAAQKAQADGKGRIFSRAEAVAVAYSEALDTGPGPGLYLRLQHRLFNLLVYRKLRAALGGRCRDAIVGGAPLNARLGHFFRGVGLTILEGYGLTETSPAVTANQPAATRIGTVGRPLPGVSIRIAADGEVLIKGDLVFDGYWNAPEATSDMLTADRWLRSGDLGEIDDDGFLRITGRKKEVIVTAAGKHVAPGPLEERVRARPLISQALLVGDQKPFVAALVTIDREAWPQWLGEHHRPTDKRVAEMRDDEELRAEVQAAIDEANKTVSHPEAIKKFRILSNDFTQSDGTLTPTLKVKRDVAQRKYAADIAAIYDA